MSAGRRLGRCGLVAALALPAVAGGQAGPGLDEWRISEHEWTVEAVPGAPISLVNRHGDLRVRALDGQRFEVLAVSQRHRDDARAVELEPERRADGSWALEVRLADAAEETAAPAAWRGRRADLTVYVPASSPLVLETGEGYLEVRGSAAAVHARTAGGELVAEPAGPFAAQSASGAVAAWLAAPAWRHPVTVETVTGEIRLGLRPDADVAIEAETQGEISTDYSLTIERLGMLRKRAVARLGAGAAPVRLKSHQGPIKLLAEAPPPASVRGESG